MTSEGIEIARLNGKPTRNVLNMKDTRRRYAEEGAKEKINEFSFNDVYFLFL